MISRFSLYGFLKNLQFFEPFIILFFLQLGLSFFEIGLLISFRSICINALEIPSGAIADIYGKKNSMIISLISYIISFMLFTFSFSFALLFPAMFFFSIGEAFRTGTHKAIIFDWLKENNRIGEKTRVYGYTRSWSKIGSSISVIISTVIVIYFHDYRYVFLFSIIPYIGGLWNIALYPSYLNRKLDHGRPEVKKIMAHLWKSLKQAFHVPRLRQLIIQGTFFEGIFKVSSDYLQPVIKAQAIVLASYFVINENNSIAIIIGIVYFVIYIISATASRNSYRVVEALGHEIRVIVILTLLAGFVVGGASAGFYFNIYIITIISYILFNVIQNVWRPILVSLYDNYSERGNQATLLSIESQSKAIGISILAPVAGLLADKVGIFSSLALLSAFLLALFFYSSKR